MNTIKKLKVALSLSNKTNKKQNKNNKTKKNQTNRLKRKTKDEISFFP